MEANLNDQMAKGFNQMLKGFNDQRKKGTNDERLKCLEDQRLEVPMKSKALMIKRPMEPKV